MKDIIENPKITNGELNRLEYLIKKNEAKPGDYARIDNYLTFLGRHNYFIGKLNDNRIEDYEDFIFQRKTDPRSVLNKLVGTALGMISVLKDHVAGKWY
jgi:hypothetical protein